MGTRRERWHTQALKHIHLMDHSVMLFATIACGDVQKLNLIGLVVISTFSSHLCSPFSMVGRTACYLINSIFYSIPNCKKPPVFFFYFSDMLFSCSMSGK